MHLDTLILQNFKNYEKEAFEFSSDINCIVGANGSGKTNLLDAIHVLSLTRSAFNNLDQQLIYHDQQYMRLLGNFSGENEKFKIELRLPAKEKKTVLLDDNVYEKLGDHLGKFPVVLIAPDDTDLVRYGSELRRKFFDAMLSQIDKQYLSNLVNYQKLLRQRNQSLKHFFEKRFRDFTLLEAYDEKLLPLMRLIARRRADFIYKNNDKASLFYKEISEDKEQFTLVYRSQCLEENLEELFKIGQEKDFATQRTNIGIHKDDFELLLDGKSIKKYASQGQQKSVILSLKLLQYVVFKAHFGQSPVLLLDDIFDKLDNNRMQRLMDLLSKNEFGQIFVSDAHPERSIEIFSKAEKDFRIFEISNGRLAEKRKE